MISKSHSGKGLTTHLLYSWVFSYVFKIIIWICFILFFYFFIFLFVVNLVIHWNETAMGLHVFRILIPPSHLPLHSLLNPFSMAMQSVIFSLILAWLFHLNKFGIIAFILIYFLLLLDEVYFHRYEKPSAFTFFILKDIVLTNRWVELDNMRIFKSRFFLPEGPLKVFFPTVLWTVSGYLRKCWHH